MKAKRFSHWPVKAGLFGCDLLALALAYFSSYHLRFWSPLFDTFKYVPIGYYLLAWPVVAAVFIACFSLLGLYETRKLATRLEIFLDCFKVATLGTLLVLPLTFWIRGFTFSRWVVILNWLLLIFFAPLFRWLYRRAIEDLRRRGRDAAPLLIVGSEESANGIAKAVASHPELGYRIEGRLCDTGQGDAPGPFAPLLGEVKDLVDVLHRHGIEAVAVADSGIDPRQEFLILQPCLAEGVRILVAPSLYDFALSVRGLRVVDQSIWYALESTMADRWYNFVKRALDVGVSLAVLIPLGLLFPVIALLIRLESRGPAIFKQQRTGTNGKPFTMYKFRSMVPEAEKILPEIVDLNRIERPAFKLENDPRVTRIGSFLRRYSIDELPQFYNVLRGDMSLVGPRPEELWIARKYAGKERARLQIKPGITGFQQIHCRGTEDFDDRLRHDLYYLNNRSFFLDLSILLETIGVVLTKKGRH